LLPLARVKGTRDSTSAAVLAVAARYGYVSISDPDGADVALHLNNPLVGSVSNHWT